MTREELEQKVAQDYCNLLEVAEEAIDTPNVSLVVARWALAMRDKAAREEQERCAEALMLARGLVLAVMKP
jgi:hypothetical protein